jgi:hypothetical protein
MRELSKAKKPGISRQKANRRRRRLGAEVVGRPICKADQITPGVAGAVLVNIELTACFF